MKWAGSEPQEADWNTRGEKIVNDVYWRQEHEPVGKHRLDRLQELIDEEIARASADAVQHHLEQMMKEADALDGTMNNAGFRFLGHLVTEERARVSLAFAAMVVDYAKRHSITLRNPTDIDR